MPLSHKVASRRVVIGVDGGNTETDLVVAAVDGEPLAYVRGPGSNSHAVGAAGCVAVVGQLLERAAVDGAAEYGAFFLCGADVPADIAELTRAVTARAWVRQVTVDNDAVALLRAGTDAPDAVAVVCGSGINCVGRAANGSIVRYPSLGWETGDWGGSGMLGREVLFRAARAEDGRDEPTVLVDVLREHFGLPSVAALGEAVHYRRIPADRLGEIAPAVVAAAEGGDAVARALVARLADEVTLLALRALDDLRLHGRPATIVLGGGMFVPAGLLHAEVERRLRGRAPRASVVVTVEPPVVGATLAALEGAGAPATAGERLRTAFRAGIEPEDVRVG